MILLKYLLFVGVCLGKPVSVSRVNTHPLFRHHTLSYPEVSTSYLEQGRLPAAYLDCHWVGSLDWNTFWEIKGVSTKPAKSRLFAEGSFQQPSFAGPWKTQVVDRMFFPHVQPMRHEATGWFPRFGSRFLGSVPKGLTFISGSFGQLARQLPRDMGTPVSHHAGVLTPSRL